jgi:hypothetical protein
MSTFEDRQQGEFERQDVLNDAHFSIRTDCFSGAIRSTTEKGHIHWRLYALEQSDQNLVLH